MPDTQRAPSDPLATTARWTAAIRAREAAQPDPLFSDPFATALAGEEGARMLSLEGPQIANVAVYVAIRTRFFDDFVLKTAEKGIRQAIFLAAGLDSRAFRLPWPPGMTVYELDRADLLRGKDEILNRENARPRCNRITVGLDLEQEWRTTLVGAGFDPRQPSLWLAEGFLFYLEKQRVLDVLAQLSSLAASGSALGADFVSESLLTSPWMQEALAAMAARGMPWKSGIDAPEKLLAEYGWKAEVKQPGEPGAGAGRWPFPVLPRMLGGIPRSFLVTALRK